MIENRSLSWNNQQAASDTDGACSLNPCSYPSTCKVENGQLHCSCPDDETKYYHAGYEQSCTPDTSDTTTTTTTTTTPTSGNNLFEVASSQNHVPQQQQQQQQLITTAATNSALEPATYLLIVIPGLLFLIFTCMLGLMAWKARDTTVKQEDNNAVANAAGKGDSVKSLATEISIDNDGGDYDGTGSMKVAAEGEGEEVAKRSLWSKLRDGFTSLRGSPPELYKCYLIKFLIAFSYTLFSLIFALFLSEEFGFSDIDAGLIYGAWGAFHTLYGLVLGTVIDHWGVAKSMQIGLVLSLIALIGAFLTTNRAVLLVDLFVVFPLAGCLGIPVLAMGIRRYTVKSSQGFAYGLFYVIMNVAALLAGPVVDFFTIWYSETENGSNISTTNTITEWTMTNNRAIILTGVVANFVACIVAFTVREIKVDSNNGGSVTAFTPKRATLSGMYKEVIKKASFWRFMIVILITLNVRMLFRHLDATLPKYMVREFGEDVPKGTIYSINPALIIVLVPFITAATTKVEPLVMIHIGSYVSAASVFFLAFSTSIWATVCFIVVLSIGEALWSPRLYDYTMSVCPEGREGTFIALTKAPLFLVKLPVGFMSGYLLEKYCPEEGERDSQTMWLIIGLVTIVSPILMTLLWGFISKKDSDDEEGTEDAKGPSSHQSKLLQPGENEQI